MVNDSNQQSRVNLDDINMSRYLSRRGYLTSSAAAATVALAGCIGDDDDVDDDDGDDVPGANGDDDGDDEGELEEIDGRVDQTFYVEQQTGGAIDPIPQTNWNYFAPGAYPWGGRDKGRITHVPFHIYSPQVDQEHMVLGESWEMVDDTTIRLELKHDAMWWDGTPLTTADLEMQGRVNEAIGQAIGEEEEDPYVVDIDYIDAKSWEINLRQPFVEGFIKNTILPKEIRVKADVYEDWAEELEDLMDDGDEDAAEDRVLDLFEWRIPNEEMYGNGPFRYVDHDDTRFVMEPFEDYVFADNIDFTELVFQEVENEGEAVISGNLDGALWSPTEQEEDRAPDLHFLDLQRTFTRGFHMNLGMFELPQSDAAEGVYDPITREPEGWLVRKAFMYASNPEQFALAMEGDAEPFPGYQSGYPIASFETDSGPIERDWIESNLENYTPHQPDKAREVLEQAGLTWDEDEEQWLNWDGEPFEVVILATQDPQEEQVLEQNLLDIGLNVHLEATEALGSLRWDGEFDVLIDGGMVSHDSIWDSYPMPGWFARMYHGPAADADDQEWHVPMPIGNTDLTDQSEREPMTIVDEFQEYLRTGDVEYLKKLLWATNQFATSCECAWMPRRYSVNAERWIVDGPDGLVHSGSRNGIFNILKHEAGTLRPRQD